MKKIACRLGFVLVLCALAAAQSAPAPTSLKPAGYVNDFAHVLDPAAAATLEQRATALNQQLKVQVAFVTLDSTGGEDAGDYSYQLAQHWGVGAKTAANGQDKDTGILIFIAITDHKYFTQIGYGLEPYITDADAGSWMRALVPQLRAGDYGAVFSAMLDQIERTLAARMPGASSRLSQIPAAPTQNSGGGNGGSPAGNIGFLLFILVVWIVGAFASRGRGGSSLGGCLWPLIFLNMGGGGGYRGGGWGGGFGGGGGGGFGGFGGGGFGGGGAGGGW